MDDRYIPSGTRVRLDALVYDDDRVASEFGVVVHCWLDDQIGGYDCYVALFGDAFPEGRPSEKPYILRYASVSLTTIED
ncbi:MAG: hypothetical protein ACK4TC_02620 [Sphingomonas pseudosanguinis]|uniref:hypothetical protein n=1 Tax=Sphingomonas pseudosanguinis TaxID=413712 RepID=UPI003918E707